MTQNLELNTDTYFNLQIKKDRTLNASIQTQVVVDDVIQDYDFSSYSGATLQVRTKPDAEYCILEFNTLDGSIVLPASGGTFKLKKSALELQYIRAGIYVYDMYLSSTLYPKKVFLAGQFIIESNISE